MLFRLCANTDPARFDGLYDALPAHVRAAVVSLSPIHVARHLHAPVEIVTAPRDKYFPVAEAQALVAASPQVRLTVTSLLAHATPRLNPGNIAELRRLYALHNELFGVTLPEDWITVDEMLAAELRDRLAELGYEGDLDKAFNDWAGTENLEERVEGVDRIDPVVLAALRDKSR